MARNAHAAAILRLVFRNGKALDIPRMRQGNDHVLPVNEVRLFNGPVIDGNFRAAGGRIAVFDVDEVAADNRHHAAFVGENVFEVGNRRFQSRQLFPELFHFQRSQSLQAHFENGVRLLFVQLERFRQLCDRDEFIRGFLDDLDDFVDVRQSEHESRDDMRALLRLVEVVAGAAGDDVFLMFEIIVENIP